MASAVAVLLVAGACSTSGLAFQADDRLRFLEPPDRALMALPVTVRWEMAERTPGTSFALFVDRVPVRPGQTLEALASGDEECKTSPVCPDAEYLAARQVYTTTDTVVTLASVLSLGSYREVQLHEATVVLLDEAGRRVGESYWYVNFRLRHRASG